MENTYSLNLRHSNGISEVYCFTVNQLEELVYHFKKAELSGYEPKCISTNDLSFLTFGEVCMKCWENKGNVFKAVIRAWKELDLRPENVSTF